jgi:hypothetical protein
VIRLHPISLLHAIRDLVTAVIDLGTDRDS